MLPQLRQTFISAGILACLSLAGACQGQPDLAPLRSAVLVETPGAKLTGADFERWLMAAPDEPGANFSPWLISTWIDQELLSEALASGKTFEDSASIAEGIWPEAEKVAIRDFFVEHAKQLPAVTDAQADSLDLTGHVRAFQQAVVLVADKATKPEKEAAAERIRHLKSLTDAGGDFTKIVRQFSEDTISKKRDGYWEMAVDRDHIPGEIATQVWSLERGMVTQPLGTPIGFAIIRRTSTLEGRASLKAWLAPLYADREAARYRDSVRTAKHFTITKGAYARIREMVIEPIALSGTEPLVTWDGGELTPATARRWLALLEPDGRAATAVSSDGDLNTFLIDVSMSEALLPKAASTLPTANGWKTLSPGYLDTLKAAKQSLEQYGGSPTAAGSATRLLDSLAIGGHEYRALPGILEIVLRSNAAVKVDHKKIDEVFNAVSMAWRAQHANDSKKNADGSRP